MSGALLIDGLEEGEMRAPGAALYGKTGRGKTHLAIAIGYRAIQNGFETLFTTAAELIEDLPTLAKRTASASRSQPTRALTCW